MNRRIFSFILCIVMLVSCIPVSADAEEITYYQIQIDAGNGVKIEKAIIDGDEIYIAASSFSKYTRFQYHDENQTYLVKGQEFDKAFKRVAVDEESKTVTVDAKQIELTNCFVADGVVYLPFCQMLPILNADIIDVNSGIIYVVNTELSMAELFYDFDIDDYWFDVNEEFFGDIEKANDYIISSYLLDTIKNLRFDRVFAFNTGLSEDYQTILTDYLKDNELYHEAMSTEDHAGNLLESITGLNETTEPLHNVYEWFESVDELEPTDKLIQFLQKSNASDNFGDELYTWVEAAHGEYIKIGKDLKAEFSFADIMEGIDWVYSFANQIEDHRHMIDAVYGISDYEKTLVPGASSPLGEVNPEFLAAKKIYQTYSDDIIPAVGKKCVETVVLNVAENAFESTTVGFYAKAISLIAEVVDLCLPGDSSERALLMHHANIMNASYHAATPVLDTEKSTNDYRLSLLMMLKASRACYQTMADNAAGYEKYKDYYQERIDEIEDMMMGLYLVAGNAGFDTYENYEAFAEQDKNILKKSGLLDNAAPYPDSIIDFLGDDISVVVEQLGNDYVDEYMFGGRCYTYDDVGAVFFFEDANGNGTTVNCILCVSDVDYGYGFSANMTYAEITELVNKHSNQRIPQPDRYYNMIEERWEFALDVTINGVHYSFAWADDPTVTDSYELVVSIPFSVDAEAFAEEVQTQYGTASYTEFESCFETMIMDYPGSIVGYLTDISVDLDQNGNNERLALISMDNSIWLQIYGESEGRYVLLSERAVTSLDYCSQQNISLFYNNNTGGYLLFVDEATQAAYTGNDSRSATIYEVNYASVDLLCEATRDDYGTATDDISMQLDIYDVPYARNCAKVDNITAQSQYKELLEIEHNTYGADPLGGWFGREHHLQLVTPEVRNRTDDAVQTWTITMKSYQGFTEYREETWTQEFEVGKQYTVLPAWQDGKETDYTVLSYSVDTQERTIIIFMDYPEGSEHWKGLVLDLENNTYYGLDYTVF